MALDARGLGANAPIAPRATQFAYAHSPVCNTACRPVPVVIEHLQRS